MYKRIIKPVLFLFSPDSIHNLTIRAGKIVQAIPPVRYAIRKMWRFEDRRLEQNIYGVNFKNPMGLAAGFDKNIEVLPLMEDVGFGFSTGGSVTLAPRRGNDRPWFHRLPNTQSLTVHAGMANIGLAKISEKLPRDIKKAPDTPLIISVAVVAGSKKETNEDAIIDAKNTIKFIINNKLANIIEINISCPNVQDGSPFCDPVNLERLLSEVDNIDSAGVKYFVKMPNLPSVEAFDEILEVISRHNIQGLTIANLVKDRENAKIDSRDELTDSMPGGLSGAPTRERSIDLIRHAYKKYGDKFVIVGVGGVFSAEDAYEKIKAGASLVGMITGVIFEGPQVIRRINHDLIKLLERDGFSSISEAVGADFKKSQ